MKPLHSHSIFTLYACVPGSVSALCTCDRRSEAAQPHHRKATAKLAVAQNAFYCAKRHEATLVVEHPGNTLMPFDNLGQ